MPDLEANKETVRAFYDLAFNQKEPEEAVARYVGSTYTQHTRLPATAPGRSSSLSRPTPASSQSSASTSSA